MKRESKVLVETFQVNTYTYKIYKGVDTNLYTIFMYDNEGTACGKAVFEFFRMIDFIYWLSQPNLKNEGEN